MTLKEKNNRLLKTYGITLEDWNYLYDKQQGKCCICKQSPEVCGRLCIDHIHQKGFKKMTSEEKKIYIRGLLCYLCNTGIKGFDKTCSGEKNRKRLLGTIEYFNKYSLKGEI